MRNSAFLKLNSQRRVGRVRREHIGSGKTQCAASERYSFPGALSARSRTRPLFRSRASPPSRRARSPCASSRARRPRPSPGRSRRREILPQVRERPTVVALVHGDALAAELRAHEGRGPARQVFKPVCAVWIVRDSVLTTTNSGGGTDLVPRSLLSASDCAMPAGVRRASRYLGSSPEARVRLQFGSSRSPLLW